METYKNKEDFIALFFFFSHFMVGLSPGHYPVNVM